MWRLHVSIYLYMDDKVNLVTWNPFSYITRSTPIASVST